MKFKARFLSSILEEIERWCNDEENHEDIVKINISREGVMYIAEVILKQKPYEKPHI